MRDTWKTREVGREMTRKSKQTIHNTYRSKCEDKQKDRPAQITAQPNRAYEWTSGRSQAPRGLGSNSSLLQNKSSILKTAKHGYLRKTLLKTTENEQESNKRNAQSKRENIANKHKKFKKASRMKSKRTKQSRAKARKNRYIWLPVFTARLRSRRSGAACEVLWVERRNSARLYSPSHTREPSAPDR